MPKFKIGDKISNGKIQYTVLDIQTNCLGDSCYVFKHPIKDNNFIWISEEVDELFELVSTNSDSFNWQSFRAEAAKDILCAMIASPSIIKLKDDKGNLIEFCKEDACKVSIEYADELFKQLKEKEEK